MSASQNKITAHAAIALAEAGEIFLVDLREPSEIAASGKAKGAVTIPLVTLPFHADPKSPEFNAGFCCGKPIVLYCAAGGRAERGRALLHDLGYEDVHNIGGLGHWQAAGGPVTR